MRYRSGTLLENRKGFKMTSTGMMGFLVVFYLATALVSGMESNWPRVLELRRVKP